MQICMHLCMCIQVHTHARTHTNKTGILQVKPRLSTCRQPGDTCIHIRPSHELKHHVHMYSSHVQTSYIHTPYTHAPITIMAHAHVLTCMHTSSHACMYAHTHTCTHAHTQTLHAHSVHVHTDTCMHMDVHTWTYTHAGPKSQNLAHTGVNVHKTVYLHTTKTQGPIDTAQPLYHICTVVIWCSKGFSLLHSQYCDTSVCTQS